MKEIEEKKQEILEIYGEMNLSMQLHDRGWQVSQTCFADNFNFIISKLYCPNCNKYSNRAILHLSRNNIKAKCVTNLCQYCKETVLQIVSRYLVVETSEGIPTDKKDVRKFSFHPKIRYNMGKEVFYVWIAIFTDTIDKRCHFYILNTKEVEKFDNINLDTYQITDNQKTELPIRNDGVVLKKGASNTGYDYSVFNTRFYYNFDALEIEMK